MSALNSQSLALVQASLILLQAYPSEKRKQSADPPGHKAPVLDENGPSKQSGLHFLKPEWQCKAQHPAYSRSEWELLYTDACSSQRQHCDTVALALAW